MIIRFCLNKFQFVYLKTHIAGNEETFNVCLVTWIDRSADFF